MTRFLQNVYFDVVVVFLIGLCSRTARPDGDTSNPGTPGTPGTPGPPGQGVHVDGSSVLGRTGHAGMARTPVLFT